MRIEARHTYNPLRWLGSLSAGLHFNSLTPIEIADARYLLKSRLRYAPILVLLANWYAGRTGMKMRVLTRSAWFRYEPLMYRDLLGCRVSASHNGLLLPRLPGDSLLSLLQKNRRLTDESELGLSLATVKLVRLHSCWTPHPWHGDLHLFSHADATIENALVDPERRRARWIDFETTHDPSLPAEVRHADDLLTLLCGTAAVIEPGELPRLCEILLRSYPSRPVANAMLELIRSWEQRPAARRLAIPALKDHHWQCLCQAAFVAAGPQPHRGDGL